MKICISGRIQTGSYLNRAGIKCYTTDVVVEEQDFCESKEANERHGASGQNSRTAGRPTPQDAGDGFMTIPDGFDEELPFA